MLQATNRMTVSSSIPLVNKQQTNKQNYLISLQEMEPIETGYRPNGQFCVLYLGNEEIRECVLQTDRQVSGFKLSKVCGEKF